MKIRKKLFPFEFQRSIPLASNRDSSFGIATMLDDRGVAVRFSAEAQHPDRLWSPPSLLFTCYLCLSPQR
jgi:hypothetical protein